MTKRSKQVLGIALLCTPLLIPFSVIAFAVASAILSSAGPDASRELMVTASIVRLVLGFLGILGTASLFTTVPIGIFLMVSAEKQGHEEATKKHQQRPE